MDTVTVAVPAVALACGVVLMLTTAGIVFASMLFLTYLERR